MSAIVGLAPSQADRKFSVGDQITLQVLIDERLGGADDKWTVLNANGKRWMVSGGVVIDTASLRSIPTDGAFTRLELLGVVHARGNVSLGTLTVKHEQSGREFPLSGQLIQDAVLYKEGAKAPWSFPLIPVGGWNYWILGGIALFLLVSAALILRYALKKVGINPLGRELDPKEKALKELLSLQHFARRKGNLRQEEWKKFSFELAAILRRYSDANFGIESLELTDREFLTELAQHKRGSKFVKDVESVLSRIDEVRYGTKELEVQLVPALLETAKKYVNDSYLVVEDKQKVTG